MDFVQNLWPQTHLIKQKKPSLLMQVTTACTKC